MNSEQSCEKKNILFQLALGIQDPWQVSETKFSEEKGRLDIYLSFKKGSKFSCDECSESLSIHDTRKRTWRHLNFFQYEAYIHTDLPRIKCPNCKTVKNVNVPWARANSGFTGFVGLFSCSANNVQYSL
jgi:transposase